MKKLLILFIFTVLSIKNLNAATFRGAPTCIDWFTVNESLKTAHRYWLVAYVSGLNVMHYSTTGEKTGKSVDVLGSVSNDRIFTYVDRYCRDKPNDNVALAGYSAFYFFERGK